MTVDRLVPTSEGADIIALVSEIAREELAPRAATAEAAGEFPRELFRKLGEQGYLALRYPEAYGGAEADLTTYCLFAEEMARGSMSVAAIAAMQGLMGTYFVYKFGSEELRQRYLVPALRGEKVATFALTEPNAGGYGNPLDREPQLVLDDVLDDFTTLELAREAYGVVIDGASMTIDSDATDELRARLRTERGHGFQGELLSLVSTPHALAVSPHR